MFIRYSRSLSLIFRHRHVPPKRRFLQEPHGVTSQKTPFFIVKTSNLTRSTPFAAWERTIRLVCNSCKRELERVQTCKILGFHGGDYEECRLLGYKNPVRASHETHYVSATESSRLMLCKI
jgi:hypothetical protein